MLLTALNSAESILPIVIIILVGYFMAKAGWIDEHTGNAFTKFILNIALPCYMIWNLIETFDRNKLIAMAGGLLVPIISKAITYFVSIPVSNLAKIDKSHKGVFRSVFFCSNTIFVGLPINLALFGTKCVPYTLLYYIVNTTMFWTVGTFEISRDGVIKNGNGPKVSIFSLATVKRLLSPALLGFIIGIILVLMKIKLPGFAVDSMNYIGATTTPLALIFIGLVLSTISFKKLKFTRDIALLLFGRFVFSPLLVAVLLRFIHIPELMGDVFIIQSAMPAMTNTSIVAKGYGADYKYAGVVTIVTTIGCVIAVPILMALLNYAH